MSEITRDDLRASIAAGMMTEAQAASLIALSEERAGVRQHLSGLDEPFELFKGFNEVFIVVGLAILYMGWIGFTGLSFVNASGTGYVLGMAYSAIALALLTLLARYFTLTRRMVAPSIALTVMVAMSGTQFGVSFAAMFDSDVQRVVAWTFGITGLFLAFFYYVFRIPFAVALIAICVFGCSFGLATIGGNFPSEPLDIFLLSADGPFAFLTIGLGIAAFIIAMIFDMSDPHRVTRRSQAGFWLHVIAAPAIVNTVALTLFQSEAAAALLILVSFIALIAIVAIAIDRRSFLVSGVGYVVALAFTVIDGGAFLVILALGAGLVLLGAKWEAIRRFIMKTLPAFPGKTRLPPWDLLSKDAPT